MNPDPKYNYPDVNLLALCIWREDRGGSFDSKVAVGWSIRNRVHHPTWWGHDYRSVILDPWQYSSFNANDPNSIKFPSDDDPYYLESLEAASLVMNLGVQDPTQDATSYYDKSLDNNPPAWAAKMDHTLDIGRLHFFKRTQD